MTAAIAAPPATGRPALYNYFNEDAPEAHRILQATYGPRYAIVSATKIPGLTPAKLVHETYPLYGRFAGGDGTTAVAFIVMPNGRIKDPVVVYSSAPRNDRLVREIVSKWIYEPAKLHGSPVAAIESYVFGVRRVPWSIGYSRPPKKKKN